MKSTSLKSVFHLRETTILSQSAKKFFSHFLLFFLVSQSLWALNVWPPLRCVQLLNAKPISFEPYLEDYLLVQNIPVTGEFIYTLDKVKSNLTLTPEKLASWKNKKVLSIGEGISGLVPYLRNLGLDALGLDLWYHSAHIFENESGKLMMDYQNRYGDFLIRGNAFELLLPNESVDIVLSHMLHANLDPAEQETSLNEILRILKPKGDLILFGIDPELKDFYRLIFEKNKQLIFTFTPQEFEGFELLRVEVHKLNSPNSSQ